MIIQLLTGAGVFLLLALIGVQSTNIATGVIQTLIQPLETATTQAFTIIAATMPILLMLAPVYLVLRKPDTPDPTTLTWTAIYGALLFTAATYTGLDTKIMQQLQTNWTGTLLANTTQNNLLMGAYLTLTYLTTAHLLSHTAKTIETKTGKQP